MAGLQEEIAAYARLAPDLEVDHLGEWVLVQAAELRGLYRTFEAAAADAVSRYGRGPYLIRQVGSEQVTLPTSVMFQPFHEADTRGI